MGWTIPHSMLPAIAILAATLVLYVPLYMTVRDIKVALLTEINSMPCTGGIQDAAKSFSAVESTAGAAGSGIVGIASLLLRATQKQRTAVDVDKLMDICAGESCLRMLTNTSSYTTKVDSAAFEDRYCKEEKVLYHMYWTKHMDDRTNMVIRSYLHTQDLKCTRLIIWTLNTESLACQSSKEGSSCSPYDGWAASKHPNNVEFRLLDIESEAAKLQAFLGAPVDPEVFRKRSGNGMGFSDLVRFTVLANYGGIYIDSDVLLLRDLAMLWDLEFAYRWSRIATCSTAVLRLKKGSATARALLDKGIGNGYKFFPLDFCKFESLEGTGLRVLPVRLFDPVWLLNDGAAKDPGMCVRKFDQAFTKPCGRLTMDGAFAYHWHNHYATPIEEGSFLGLWMAFLEKTLP